MDEEKIVELDRVPDVEDVIVVNDGRINVTIQNQFGEKLGTFRFSPTDLNMVNRYNESGDRFKEIAKPLVDFDISPTGEGETEEAMEALNEAEDMMIELFDYVLNGDSRAAFFNKIHVFTPMDGTFFCGIVFEAVGDYIAKKFEVETKRIDLRLQKHVHGYRTGKHKKGDR